MEEFHLEPGERVIRTVRKHWFVLLTSLIPFAFFAWIPAAVPGILAGISWAPDPSIAMLLSFVSFDNAWFRLTLGMWWLLLWVAGFSVFTEYYLNHWVITTLRIVRVRQHGFFSRQVSSFLLSRVQDVTTDVNGIFADLLGYGAVRVQTAGTAANHFVMDGIEDPQGMRDLILSHIAALYRDRNTSFVGMHL